MGVQSNNFLFKGFKAMLFHNKQERSLKGLENFLKTSLDAKLQQSRKTNPEAKLLTLFQDVASNVPAYQAFLQENNINPQSIQTIGDFQSLPLLNKKNYILELLIPYLLLFTST